MRDPDLRSALTLTAEPDTPPNAAIVAKVIREYGDVIVSIAERLTKLESAG